MKAEMKPEAQTESHTTGQYQRSFAGCGCSPGIDSLSPYESHSGNKWDARSGYIANWFQYEDVDNSIEELHLCWSSMVACNWIVFHVLGQDVIEIPRALESYKRQREL